MGADRERGEFQRSGGVAMRSFRRQYSVWRKPDNLGQWRKRHNDGHSDSAAGSDGRRCQRATAPTATTSNRPQPAPQPSAERCRKVVTPSIEPAPAPGSPVSPPASRPCSLAPQLASSAQSESAVRAHSRAHSRRPPSPLHRVRNPLHHRRPRLQPPRRRGRLAGTRSSTCRCSSLPRATRRTAQCR